MKRWLTAYETDTPDPARRQIRRDITAHAYDAETARIVHEISNSYRVAADEPWTGFTGGAHGCETCTDFMADVDTDENVDNEED